MFFIAMSALLDLNEYALEQIFEYLTEKELVNLSLTCRTLAALVQNFLRPIVNKKLMVCNIQR